MLTRGAYWNWATLPCIFQMSMAQLKITRYLRNKKSRIIIKRKIKED